jgi:hypothetical protein
MEAPAAAVQGIDRKHLASPVLAGIVKRTGTPLGLTAAVSLNVTGRSIIR